MKTPASGKIGWMIAALLAGGSFALLGGCATNQNGSTNGPTPSPAQQPGQPGSGQPVFETDTEVANALLAAVKAQDHDQIHALLGPDWPDLVSDDKAQAAESFKEFAQRASEKMRLDRTTDSITVLVLGNDGWSFPIPIVKDADGKWFLDTAAGETEVLARRVGKDELQTIELCRLYVKAQQQYVTQDHDGTGIMKYATRVRSTPGKTDGLFWPTDPGQQPSPLGDLIAQAKLQDYQPGVAKHEPYHGYHFRVLKSQGPDAPGGKYDYVINGNMVAGFALVAFPSEYGSTGIMTFIVNQSGKVYQKDLGENTPDIARHMDQYNPDSSWTLVKD